MSRKKKKRKTLEELLEEALVPEEEQPYPVPENWVWVRLGSICDINMGQSPRGEFTSSNSEEIPLIGGPVDMGDIYPDIKRYTSKPTKLSKNGDLIVSVRATLGKTNISNGVYCLGRGVAGVSSDIIDVKLLRYYFENIKEYLYKIGTGTTFSQISRKDIEQLSFPLPSLNEQKRIADKVERLLNKIDQAEQLIKEAKETFERRRAAILDQAFRGELTEGWREKNSSLVTREELKERVKNVNFYKKNKKSLKEVKNPPYELPEGWIWVYLEDVTEKITDGTHHSPKSFPEGDYKYITAKNIQEEGIVLENITYVTEEVHREIYRRCDVRKGDVLYIKDGATTGIATVNTLDEEFSLLSSVGVIRTLDSILHPQYLKWCLNSPRTKERMLSMMSGIAIRRLTLKKIKGAIIPLPPIEEQRLIIQKLLRFNDLDRKIKVYTENDILLDRLKQSILSKAFRGELGTNDPLEESAIELLKEVLQEQVK